MPVQQQSTYFALRLVLNSFGLVKCHALQRLQLYIRKYFALPWLIIELRVVAAVRLSKHFLPHSPSWLLFALIYVMEKFHCLLISEMPPSPKLRPSSPALGQRYRTKSVCKRSWIDSCRSAISATPPNGRQKRRGFHNCGTVGKEK